MSRSFSESTRLLRSRPPTTPPPPPPPSAPSPPRLPRAAPRAGAGGARVVWLRGSGPRRAGGARGQRLEIHAGGQLHVAGVHAEDRLTSPHVGLVDHHPAVEAAGAAQPRPAHLAAVGG